MIKDTFIFDGQPDAQAFEKKQKSMFETRRELASSQRKKKVHMYKQEAI